VRCLPQFPAFVRIIAGTARGVRLAPVPDGVRPTSDRVRDLAVLRLAGAAHGQVLRLVAAEALLVVAVGGLLGLLVAGLNLAGMRAALGLLSAPGTIALPWTALAGPVAAGRAGYRARTRHPGLRARARV